MKIIKKVVLAAVLLVISFPQNIEIFAQNTETEESSAISRGSIPDELLRPRRDEAPRYPVDIVIGAIGRGKASDGAYAFARNVASALVDGRMSAPALSAKNTMMLENYLSALEAASPRSFRLGGGREEADGSYSFLARFIGREQSITGELFVRFDIERRRPSPPPAEEEEADADVAPNEMAANETEVTPEAGSLSSVDADGSAATETAEIAVAQAPVAVREPVWIFDELILEEARSRKAEDGEARHRFDFPPYERFF